MPFTVEPPQASRLPAHLPALPDSFAPEEHRGSDCHFFKIGVGEVTPEVLRELGLRERKAKRMFRAPGANQQRF